MKLAIAILMAITVAVAQVPPFTQLSDAERIALQNLLRESEAVYARFTAAAIKANAEQKAAKEMQSKVESRILEMKIAHGALNCTFTPLYQFTDCGKAAPAVPPGPKAKKK